MIKIKESELHFSFVRSSGPGGQHVNKVSTAVQLKYNIFESDISDEMRQRFISAYGKRISKNGFITIIAQSYKSQKKNKDDAINWLKNFKSPYEISIHDFYGTLALDLGVTGAPETYLLKDGIIVRRHIGELNIEKWRQDFAEFF